MTGVSESVSEALFRQVLGCYPTGVVVVAALVDGAPQGLAVNSFTSVSLDPPLVAFCAAHSSTTWPVLRRSASFAVSVLSDEQEQACRVFARKGADRFAGMSWAPSPGGHPVLDGALAWLEVRADQVLPAGDHELVIGAVTSLAVATAGNPLVFVRSGFAGVAAPRRSARPADAAASTVSASAEPASVLGHLRGLDVESPFFSVLAARLGEPQR